VEKLVYVLWKRAGDGDDAFVERMLGPTARRLRELGVRGLSMNLVDAEARSVARARITHLDPPISGLASFWLDAADDRGPAEQALATATARLAGYLVVESVPIVNRTRIVPLGQRTPGIQMVALIERPERLSREAWIEHWHGPHRRVAIETQCTFLYVRNVVVRALTPGAPPWEGIVEEGFPTEAVTDPMLWYKAGGSPEKLRENMGRMLESVQAFLDIARVESHPTSQYRLVE
jgi:hypothetical protein